MNEPFTALPKGWLVLHGKVRPPPAQPGPTGAPSYSILSGSETPFHAAARGKITMETELQLNPEVYVDFFFEITHPLANLIRSQSAPLAGLEDGFQVCDCSRWGLSMMSVRGTCAWRKMGHPEGSRVLLS